MPAPFDPNPLLQEYAHPERLVSASWLSARLGSPGLKVVESNEDSLLYDIGHIPGAVRIDWFKDLNSATIRDYITGEDFAALMDSKGIGRDDTVVVYGDKSNWWAAFTLWVFDLFGHEDVRLLNGGRDAWMAEERDTSFAVPEYPPQNYPVVEREDSRQRIFVDQLRQKLGQIRLLDVRDEAAYQGTEDPESPQTGVLRQGHIPGAVNMPWDQSVHPNARFRSREELEELYSDFLDDQETAVYCHIGERAAHTWFALKFLLGKENVRNYDGGWAEWGNMVRLPIERS